MGLKELKEMFGGKKDKPETSEKKGPDSPGGKGPDKPDSPDKPKTPEKKKPDSPSGKDFDSRIRADPATMKKLDALHKKFKAEAGRSKVGATSDTAPDKGQRERDLASETKSKPEKRHDGAR